MGEAWKTAPPSLIPQNILNNFSQDGHPETNFRIVPVSPNAASLGTFGMIPTDNYVGQANLTIPIYEIDLDGKKFPIALSYHTDGTRVAQEATWIGLGWTLQAGGCVVRQVQGTDDFAARGCYNLTDAPWLTNPRPEFGEVYGLFQR